MDVVDWIGAWPGARLLQRSALAYLLVNAAHILAIGLVLGAILPLDIRLMGVLRGPPLAAIGPFLSRAAAVGVAFALATGGLLFSVKPDDYLANAAWRWKMALLLLALAAVAIQHANPAFKAALQGGPLALGVRATAFASAGLWLGVLVAGRWIGFL